MNGWDTNLKSGSSFNPTGMYLQPSIYDNLQLLLSGILHDYFDVKLLALKKKKVIYKKCHTVMMACGDIVYTYALYF